MTVIGLLLSLSEPPEQVAGYLRRNPAVTVGDPAGSWLPVAAEAADDAGCRELHDWIAAAPGVVYVDVVHVNFEAIGPSHSSNPNYSFPSVQDSDSLP